MKNLKVEDIIRETNGTLITGNMQYECKKYSKDTRSIEPEDCYIGIKGATFDGNKFWKQALENGASTVIVENIDFTEEDKMQFTNKNIIKVENTLEALYKIASYKRSLYNIPVIAITGSVGKTSTKDIVANVVSQKYKTLKTIGNLNNNIGMPFTILKLQDEEAMVLEMGMNHAGEISLLSKIAKPTICIITNIGTSHIGNLGSRENILKAKLEILDGSQNPNIIINNDDDLLNKWNNNNLNNGNKPSHNVITYGIKEKSDFNATAIELKSDNSTFECELNNEKAKINVPVAGEHFILNSLCAICVGKELNIETSAIIKGIESFELTKKRNDITKMDNDIQVINAAYNASPEAMEASIKALGKYEGNRKIAVLGDMLELGDFSEELHRKIGKEAYKNKIDILICSGKLAKYTAIEAKESGMNEENIYYLEEKEQIYELLQKIVKPKDVILFKASNLMKFYEIAEKFIKWNFKGEM